jgi:SPOR domain
VRDPKPSVRSDDTGMRRQIRDNPPPSQWSAAVARLDIFWPILAVILTAAVIFVAVVAHTSMDSVGAVPTRARPAPTPTPSSTTETLVIVQVSSHPTRAKAEAAATDLDDQGLHPQILKSDDYSPLNRGFFVVYVGPYPDTENGRAAAKQVQSLLPGALLREIHPR